eukprot:jgi/Mesvir1/27707/Mv07415-RA.1
MLYIIGLGLEDERDITLKGLDAVRRCSRVYLEAYTSILLVQKDKLEELYGKEVIVADREMVEQRAEEILRDADKEDVAFLVVGDPFSATTHADIQLRARQKNIPVRVLHNASVINAVGGCGLQLYRFGETVSIVFFTETWRPQSFYDKIKANRSIGLHTLCLLDIRVKELTTRALCRGIQEYEPPRYMTVNTALEELLEVEEDRKEGVYNKDTLCVGMARLGTATQMIAFGTMEQLLSVDFGPPLHCLVICGEVHPTELEILELFQVGEHQV